MKKLLFSFILLIPSCGQYVEDRRSDDFEPIYLGNIEEEQVQPGYGAIFKPNQSRLFAMESRACLLYTSPSPRDRTRSRMPSSA